MRIKESMDSQHINLFRKEDYNTSAFVVCDWESRIDDSPKIKKDAFLTVLGLIA
jgi:hypothetical protein